MSEESKHPSAVLQHCLVEDEGATLRSPRRRRLSLLLSATLQVAILGGVLLIPLLVNGEKLEATVLLAPIPPYRGVQDAVAETQTTQQPRGGKRRPPIGPVTVIVPNKFPDRAAQIDDRADFDFGPSIPIGPGFPVDSLPIGSNSSRTGPLPPMPKPPAPPPVEVLNVHEGVQAARLIHRVDPAYTPFLRSIRAQGTVRLRALIARDGTVKELEVIELKGHPLLAKVARDAIEQWRYQPTLLNGKPVEVDTQITVVFVLGQ